MMQIFLFMLLLYVSDCKSIVDNNDTALEYLNNCKCVSEIYCYNGVMNIRGIGIMTLRNNVQPQNETMRIQCYEPTYICCRENPEEKIRVRNEPQLVPTQLLKSKTSTESSNILKTNKSKEKCGKQKPVFNVRILSDPSDMSAAIDGEFPWMTSIFRKNELDGRFKFRCAGSLISDRVVLTAAHCVYSARKKPSEIKVSANAKIQLKEIGADPHQERAVAKILVHSEYYAGAGHNDIALLILEKSYNDSRQLNSVCLPQQSSNLSKTNCIATGWSNKDKLINPGESILRKVELPLVDRDRCETLLKKSRLGSNFVLHESFICAGGENHKDTCKGDGGGPLICPNDEGHFTQVGIVSWGVDCGLKYHPGVYTDVARLENWIKSNIEQDFTT